MASAENKIVLNRNSTLKIQVLCKVTLNLRYEKRTDYLGNDMKDVNRKLMIGSIIEHYDKCALKNVD